MCEQLDTCYHILIETIRAHVIGGVTGVFHDVMQPCDCFLKISVHMLCHISWMQNVIIASLVFLTGMAFAGDLFRFRELFPAG